MKTFIRDAVRGMLYGLILMNVIMIIKEFSGKDLVFFDYLYLKNVCGAVIVGFVFYMGKYLYLLRLGYIITAFIHVGCGGYILWRVGSVLKWFSLENCKSIIMYAILILVSLIIILVNVIRDILDSRKINKRIREKEI